MDIATFPFLFGGTFIEAIGRTVFVRCSVFPFLFGGTFIEAIVIHHWGVDGQNFPSFSEGLSLRRRRQYLHR